MAKNAQIAALNEVGQSIWYDNLSRPILRSGELKKFIDDGVSGLTSNPTIFKKAIADTSDYDEDIKALAKGNATVDEIIEELMIRDIAEAADLLKPVYDATRGGDGYASIEVSPTLAHDTAGSITAARRIWKKLNRPNIMVKIPGTAEGIPAIGTLLEEGININITLLFSDKMYRKVAEIYISALEKRLANGGDIKSIAAVASFFVSRVDTICEKQIDSLIKAGKLQPSDKAKVEAKVGIANSREAYASFESLFSSEQWKKLERAGARKQRPLWASTGTKNPAYSPVLYVEELAGRDTVNTVPPQTLAALMAKAEIQPRVYDEKGSRAAVLKDAAALGLDLDALLDQLVVEGVKSFNDSYTELAQAVEGKRSAVS